MINLAKSQTKVGEICELSIDLWQTVLHSMGTLAILVLVSFLLLVYFDYFSTRILVLWHTRAHWSIYVSRIGNGIFLSVNIKIVATDFFIAIIDGCCQMLRIVKEHDIQTEKFSD